jgi:hypothetical protein
MALASYGMKLGQSRVLTLNLGGVRGAPPIFQSGQVVILNIILENLVRYKIILRALLNNFNKAGHTMAIQ